MQAKTKEPPTSTVGVRRFCYDSVEPEIPFKQGSYSLTTVPLIVRMNGPSLPLLYTETVFTKG